MYVAFTVAASYGEYKNETDTTTLTISKSMFDLNFSASYIDADRVSTSTSAANTTNSNKEFFVVNVSKTF